MNSLTKRTLQGFTAIMVAVFPVVTSAATLYNPLGEASIPQLIGRVIQLVLGISGSLALLMFVYGGLIWLTASGEPGKIEKGKKTLIWATIGIGVLFGSFALANFVVTGLGAAVVPPAAPTP
ncbi:hypothetical protein HOI83_00365 [Candidatus Uhrbacteria bacterium]|jgi:hypothetical protein|nr:hypothetical protein [Candidatus Uhrbacteria bacterium]